MRRLTPDRIHELDAPRALGVVPRETAATTASASAAAVDPEAATRAAAAALAAERSAAREQGRKEGLHDAEQDIAARVERIEAGLRRDHEAKLAELESARQRLHTLSGSLARAVTAHAETSEIIAVEVAYAGVLRLLGELAADRTLITTLCRAVVRDYGHPPATLRVNDDDLALLDVDAVGIPVEADRRLAPGQCVVDTPRGQFESGLDVRLEALKLALLAGLRSGSAA